MELLTPIQVKTSNLAATNEPLSVVFPLNYGEHQDVPNLVVRKTDGTELPTQVSVLNRWYGKDNSIRHVRLEFMSDIPAYTEGAPASGLLDLNVYLEATPSSIPTNAVTVSENASSIVMDNGLVSINIAKDPMVITTPAGVLESVFTTESGSIDLSFYHADITFEVEHIGPIASIVHIYSRTDYIGPTDIKHGWAMRLYMYSNSEQVKVDFQLQNSALNTRFSAPLFFQAHELTLSSAGTTSSEEKQVASEDETGINSGEAGTLLTPNVNVLFKDFYQKYPQGLKSSDTGVVTIETFPQWSEQYRNAAYSGTGLYWIDDMAQVFKEIMLDFSGDSSIIERSANFQYPVLGVVPQDYYTETAATLDWSGLMVPSVNTGTEDARKLTYTTDTMTPGAYATFGQSNFGLDTDRKYATSTTGGYPYSGQRYFVTGNPQDAYSAKIRANAELNIRPQWLAGYTHADHQPTLNISANPYGGNTWRAFDGASAETLTRQYSDVEGSGSNANPRDDQHAWFYHMEHAYLITGCRWIKDWFEFMAERQQTYLNRLDPYPDTSERSEGHNLAVALSAYRTTGNSNLGTLLEGYMTNVYAPTRYLPHNLGNGDNDSSETSMFQLGYLTRQFAGLYSEFDNQVEVLTQLGYIFDWNINYANFCYYKPTIDTDITVTASETSHTAIDPALWFAHVTGRTDIAAHALGYMDYGIGGVRPYYNTGQVSRNWNASDFHGQMIKFYTDMHPTVVPRPDDPIEIPDYPISLAQPIDIRLSPWVRAVYSTALSATTWKNTETHSGLLTGNIGLLGKTVQMDYSITAGANDLLVRDNTKVQQSGVILLNIPAGETVTGTLTHTFNTNGLWFHTAVPAYDSQYNEIHYLTLTDVNAVPEPEVVEQEITGTNDVILGSVPGQWFLVECPVPE